MRKNRQRLRTLLTGSFRRRLTFSFIAIAVVPLVLCGFLMIAVLQSSVERGSRQDAESEISRQDEMLTTLLDGVSSSLDTLSNASPVKAALKRERENVPAVNTLLFAKTADIRESVRIDILTADGSCIYTTGSRQDGENLPTNTGILYEAQRNTGSLAILAYKPFSSSVKSRSGTRIRAARAVTTKDNGILGYVTASVSKENLDTLCSPVLSSRDGLTLLNRFGEEVYSTQTAYELDAAEKIRESLLNSGKAQGALQGFSLYIRPVGTYGLTQILIKRNAIDDTTQKQMTVLLWLFTMMSLGICVFAAVRISQSLSRPITDMTEAMEEVKRGNLAVRIPEGRPDELGTLSENFNVMTARIDENMREKVANEKKLNDVRIAMMQAQLNPHFLYNTLDSIKWLSKEAGVPEIATLSSKLARILRTAISGDAFIPLSEEFGLCESYGEIQNIRFLGRYTFTFLLPKELEEAKVPKLILQPIVENACIHGLDDREGRIVTAARAQGNDLVLSVEDDGSGMDDAMIARINMHALNGKSGHIGLSNVDMICRLNYGTEYGLSALKRDGGGTVIRIVLPLTFMDGKHEQKRKDDGRTA